MLKITTQTGANETIFALEGKLAGPWVQELQSCWRQAAIGDQQVRLVLNAVTFIDGSGIKLLADMHRQGVVLAAEGFMMKAIIEEIMRGET
jgi:anti-anti-sigma regulatory factor